jgi:hypothetical protein
LIWLGFLPNFCSIRLIHLFLYKKLACRERPPHGIILRKSAFRAPTKKGHETCPPRCRGSAPYRPDLYSCFESAQPLHEDPSPIGQSISCAHNQGNQRVAFFNLSLKFAHTRIHTQDLMSATQTT